MSASFSVVPSTLEVADKKGSKNTIKTIKVNCLESLGGSKAATTQAKSFEQREARLSGSRNSLNPDF